MIMNSQGTVQWIYLTGRETVNIDNGTSRVRGDYKDNEISLE